MHKDNLPDGMIINKVCNICEVAKKTCIKRYNKDGTSARRCQRCCDLKFEAKGCLYRLCIRGKRVKGIRPFADEQYYDSSDTESEEEEEENNPHEPASDDVEGGSPQRISEHDDSESEDEEELPYEPPGEDENGDEESSEEEVFSNEEYYP